MHLQIVTCGIYTISKSLTFNQCRNGHCKYEGAKKTFKYLANYLNIYFFACDFNIFTPLKMVLYVCQCNVFKKFKVFGFGSRGFIATIYSYDVVETTCCEQRVKIAAMLHAI